MSELVSIPVIDVGAGGPVRHAAERSDRARAVRDDCLAFLPPPARSLVPLLDSLSRRWLERSRSPYVADIEAIAASLGLAGIWFLNGSYEWGCTAAARDEHGRPWLVRTLDWPYSGLGRHVEVARMRGAAGEFLSLTWPGYVGTLTAVAPGRFAAAMNQAPLWRRTRRPWLRPFDLAANGLHTWSVRFCPPDHLLREVFETCRDFGEARRRLETVPLARPAIYVLIGCEVGERCVIERTEEGCNSRAEETSAANDWMCNTEPWEARISTQHLLKMSYEEAAARCRARCEALRSWPQSFSIASFAWVKPPVLNPLTRIAAAMCAADATLRAVGYELEPNGELAQPVTHSCEISACHFAETAASQR